MLATRSPVLLPGVESSSLQVGRAASLRAVDAAEQSDGRIVVVPQRNPDVLAPTSEHLHRVGVLAEIASIEKTGPRNYVVTLQPRERCAVAEYISTVPMFVASVEPVLPMPGYGIDEA